MELIRDGKKPKFVWFRASTTPMTVDGKRHAVIVLLDITESKNSEFEILKARDHYLSILENFPYMIWKTDMEGNIDYIDKKWSDFTGKPQEELFKSGWLDLVHPEDKNSCVELSQYSIYNKAPLETELRVLNHNGEYRWIHSVCSSFNDGTKFNGYLGMATDITEKSDRSHVVL